MRSLPKILPTLGLLLLAGSCGFGLLATFEPLPPVTQWTWRILYVSALVAAGWGMARLWFRSSC